MASTSVGWATEASTPGQYSKPYLEGKDWKPGVRGREAVGSWVPREEEQEVRLTELFYDRRRLAPRDQWYRLGRSLTDRERPTAGLDKMLTLEQNPTGQLGQTVEADSPAHSLVWAVVG